MHIIQRPRAKLVNLQYLYWCDTAFDVYWCVLEKFSMIMRLRSYMWLELPWQDLQGCVIVLFVHTRQYVCKALFLLLIDCTGGWINLSQLFSLHFFAESCDGFIGRLFYRQSEHMSTSMWTLQGREICVNICKIILALWSVHQHVGASLMRPTSRKKSTK